MSVQFTQNPQQVVMIENGNDDQQRLRPQGTRAPPDLNRMNSRSEDKNPYAQVQEQLTEAQIENYSREVVEDRRKMRRIFDRYDTNHDNYLSKKELRRLLKETPNECSDIPKGIAKAMLHLHDEDGDGQLDFEEFYKLSKEHRWIVRDMCVRYCRYIVPRRGGYADETGIKREIEMREGGRLRAHPHMHGMPADFDVVDIARDGAYEKEMKFFPPPLTMIIFSIIEVAFFVTDVYYTRDYHDDKNINTIGTSTSGPIAKFFIYTPYKREEAWRFVTYMFVHVGIMHILMNLIVQIFLGTALELVHCWWRVALVYLAGVAAGSMGTSIANPNVSLAGASGGVYALITAHIATIILNWHEMEYACMQLFVFLVFCSTDLGMSIYRHITVANDKVGYVAHLCGAIAGLLVGIGVLRNLNVRPYEKKLWWAAVTIYTALMVTGICFHIFYPDYFPPTRNATPQMSGIAQGL